MPNSRRGVLRYLIICILMDLIAGLSIPDFSMDYHTTDVHHQLNFSTDIAYIRVDDDDIPDECRFDICYGDGTRNRIAGSFEWPVTQVGFQLFIRCPYSVNGKKYAFRTCALFDNLTFWDEPDYQDCPGPPLYEYLQSVKKVPLKFSEMSVSDLLKHTHQIVQIMIDYPDAPEPLEEDNSIITQLLVTLINRTLENEETLPLSSVNDVLQLMEVIYFSMEAGAHVNVAKLLVAIGEVIPLQATTPLVHIQREMFEFFIWSGDLENIKLGDSLSINLMNNHGNNKGNHTNVVLRHTLIKDSASLLPIHLSHAEDGVDNGTLSDDKDKEMCFKKKDSDKSVTELFRMSDYEGRLSHISVAYSDGKQRNPCLMEFTHTFKRSQPLHSTDVMCGLSTMPDTQVILDSGETSWGDHFLDNYCRTEVMNNTVTCHCRATGYVGAFSRLISMIQGYLPPAHDIHHEAPVTLTQFLGFEYNAALYIADHVLRPISIFCLVATVISFAVFRRTRRGSVTHILVNLCVSLIWLQLISYVPLLTTDIKTVCVVINILRFYFIFVSLFWNGIEAYNLYLKVVKVFDSNISNFMLRACLVAYGMPAVLTSVIALCITKAFRGQYVDCIYKCIPSKDTLHYGYLIPMSIIIVHNMVVFGMVMRVLIRQSNTRKEGTKHWERLIGAISVMVLLGVPWIFSVFGFLDPEMGIRVAMLEFIFQVIFVITFNLQGMFIFIFHCARVQEIRASWGSTFTKRFTHTGSSDIPLSNFTGKAGSTR